jgi:tRNA threonylcarbamoyl adenosine modification protein (Sua5/YciO/YrdC/YwlC family)
LQSGSTSAPALISVPSIAPIVEVAPSKPDEAVVRQVVTVLNAGGVVAFPTDTLYGIGCEYGQTHAAERIQAMRQIDSTKRPLTFMLPDIGLLPHYAIVHEQGHRILNRIFPGPYCVELTASPRVPAPFTHEDRRTIGVRIPDSALCERMLWMLRHPLLTASAKSRAGVTLTTAQAIRDEYGSDVDLIIDGGELAGPPSTVVSLVDDWVTVLREGRGPAGKILLG